MKVYMQCLLSGTVNDDNVICAGCIESDEVTQFNTLYMYAYTAVTCIDNG